MSMDGKGKVKVNHNHNFMGFDTIDINLVLINFRNSKDFPSLIARSKSGEGGGGCSTDNPPQNQAFKRKSSRTE